MSADLLLRLLAIFVMIAIGFATGRARVLSASAADTLSGVTFLVFAPALLFRTMAGVSVAALPWRMLIAYFVPTVALLLAMSWWQRQRGVGGVVRGLSVSFGNMVQLGVPVVTALFGADGLALHISIISVHALVLLTTATVLAELRNGEAPLRSRVGQTVRRSLIHPVTLPILLGLAYHATGLPLPGLVDDVLSTLGAAVVPLSLIAIGLGLHQYGLADGGRTAPALAAGKLVAHPLLVLTAGWLAGLHGLPLTVAVLCAALPSGANVLLFAARYDTHQAEATATIVLATFAFTATITAWLVLLT